MSSHPAPFKWLNEDSRTFLRRGYLSPDQTAEQRVLEIADHAEDLLRIPGFASKFYEYMSRGWFSLSSPVWSNYGTDRGFPVSCFGSHIEDSTHSILDKHKEVGMMSKHGGGCSGYFGEVRPRGASIGNNNGESYGSVHFMELFDKLISVISQGSVRRGFFSAYQDIDHPDIEEFIGIGSDGHPIQGLTHGVVVSEEFVNRLKEKDKDAARVWARVINNRFQVGYPYILFSDNVNNNTVDVYKDRNMKINASNLCSEICLPSSSDESFVCVLSSMNLEKWDEWKDTDAVQVLTTFLDSVVTEFLDKLQSPESLSDGTFRSMSNAYRFAKRHRALGIGTLGWHSLLQSKDLPFDCKESAQLNLEIFKHIEEESWEASKKLADRFGEPEYLRGYGRRNTTLTAVAPTKSSSFILGQVSQGIEPFFSNYFVDDKAKIKITWKNPYLDEVLSNYEMNTQEVWDSIRDHDGSVQHLEWLLPHHKEVFKTFGEINPYAILNQAATRQPYIDQSQSLNLMIGPRTSAKEMHEMYMYAHDIGIKSLYYQFGTSAAQEISRNLDCQACGS